NFQLFTDECRPTDDTVITLAVAKAIMETEKELGQSFTELDYDSGSVSLLEKKTTKYLQEIGRRYPDCGYGSMFKQWLFAEHPVPYNSFGNGAAMRISPAGWVAGTGSEAALLSDVITKVTHNHDEGLKGAEVTAVVICMAKRGSTKQEIQDLVISYYSLDFTIDDIRDKYRFDETCQESVPQAIQAFLESTSFEDAIRIAISLGGDSDTLAAITGSIAEAYYGVPDILKEQALSYLDHFLLEIYNDWENFLGYQTACEPFHVLTKYIGRFSEGTFIEEWVIDRRNDGTSQRPVHIPYIDYTEMVQLFTKE